MSSPASALAEGIVSRLQASPGLAGAFVLHDRQKDLPTSIAAALARMQTAVLVWLPRRSRPRDAAPGDPWEAEIAVDVAGSPMLRGPDAPTVDQAVDEVVAALDGWKPDAPANGGHWFDRVRVHEVELLPDPRHLAYSVRATARARLS